MEIRSDNGHFVKRDCRSKMSGTAYFCYNSLCMDGEYQHGGSSMGL